MFKKCILVIIFFVALPMAILGQSLTISEKDNTISSTSEFDFQNGNVVLSENEISFASGEVTVTEFEAYGLSPDLSVIGLLSISDEDRKATILNTDADTLSEYEVTNFDSGERSLKFYPFNSGGSLIRNNIANFNIYDSFGERIENVSSAVSGAAGQAISEVAMDPGGRSIAIYTPNVEYESSNGSIIQFLGSNMRLQQIFDSSDRTIEAVEFSKNGQFLAVLTKAQGTDDRIFVLDRHGNELNAINSSEDNVGVSITKNGNYVIPHTNSRAVVYGTLSGEREAGTSFNAQLLEVQFFTEDNLLVALTGSHSEDAAEANDLRFHAINFETQQIAREDYGSSLGFSDYLPRYFERTDQGNYQFRGANKVVELTTSF